MGSFTMISIIIFNVINISYLLYVHTHRSHYYFIFNSKNSNLTLGEIKKKGQKIINWPKAKQKQKNNFYHQRKRTLEKN